MPFRCAGQGVTADEYVCGGNSAEGAGGIVCPVPYGRNVARGSGFCVSGNEEDGSIFYRRYDVSLEYNLQFFAAEGQGGEKTEPATEKN